MAELSYVHGASSIPLLGETIGENLRKTVEKYPENDALVVVWQNYRATYKQFWQQVTEIAKGLLHHNIKKGDRVGIWSPNRYEWVILQYASARVGAILVNINPSYRINELEYALNLSEVKLMISAKGFKGADYEQMLHSVHPNCHHLEKILIMENDWNNLIESGKNISDQTLEEIEKSLQFDDPINIQYTSGTTGFPKGVTLSHHSVLNNGYFIAKRLNYSDKDRVCIPVPFYHCFGMVIGNLVCTTNGACIVVASEAFEPDKVMKTVTEEKCTSLYGVPTMFIAELDHPDFDKYDFSSLRTGVMAGSPCPNETMNQVQSKMHMKEVAICYGMTETSPVSTQTFVDDTLEKRVSTIGKAQDHALKLLEMQRNALLMYTSCGWFFDEVSGLETVQIIQYAAKVIQYINEFGDKKVEAKFIEMLRNTPSNIHENAVYIYENYVKPVKIDLIKVGIHYAISSLFEEYHDSTTIGAYKAYKDSFNLLESGKIKLAIGKIKIISDLTWEEEIFNFAVLHLGDNNISCGIQKFDNDQDWLTMEDQISSSFNRGDITEVTKLMNNYFADNTYSLFHLFKDEQRKILDKIMQITYDGIEASYRQIYDNNYSIMSFYKSLNIPLPKSILASASNILESDLKKVFESEEINIDKLENIINDIRRWSIDLDKKALKYVAGNWIYNALDQVNQDTDNIHQLQKIEQVLALLSSLDITLKFWKAQNIYFEIAKSISLEDEENEESETWLDSFNKVGEYLRFDTAEI